MHYRYHYTHENTPCISLLRVLSVNRTRVNRWFDARFVVGYTLKRSIFVALQFKFITKPLPFCGYYTLDK